MKASQNANRIIRKGRNLASAIRVVDGLDSDAATEALGDIADEFREEVELVKGACPEFNIEDYLNARQTPVLFGSALSNFGVKARYSISSIKAVMLT